MTTHIDGNYLVVDGNKYKIRYANRTILILDTDKLYGRFGDEFPLKKIDYVVAK